MATKKLTQKEKMENLVEDNLAKQMKMHPDRPRRQNIIIAEAISAQTSFPKDREEKAEKKPSKKAPKRKR